MPNTNISLYLSDTDYTKYIKVKKTVNAKIRELIKQELNPQTTQEAQ